MGYTLADLELKLAERRLALQTAALGGREQRGELRAEAERSGEDAASNQHEARDGGVITEPTDLNSFFARPTAV